MDVLDKDLGPLNYIVTSHYKFLFNDSQNGALLNQYHVVEN